MSWELFFPHVQKDWDHINLSRPIWDGKVKYGSEMGKEMGLNTSPVSTSTRRQVVLSHIHEQKSRHLVMTMRDQISVRPGRRTTEKGKNVLACWKKAQCVGLQNVLVQKGRKRFHWYESAEVTYYILLLGGGGGTPTCPTFFFDHGQKISNSVRPRTPCTGEHTVASEMGKQIQYMKKL